MPLRELFATLYQGADGHALREEAVGVARPCRLQGWSAKEKIRGMATHLSPAGVHGVGAW